MKKYELSLSRNYVSSWGIEEAIRELLQNAKDSNGEDVIDIDKSSGTITITNKNTSIPSSTLLLGNTSKKDNLDKIGQFGEGYKLALLVLLRENKKILIKNGNKNWMPSFEYSDNFKCEVLCITETEGAGNDLTFEISGFDSSELDELENEFLGLNGQAYNSIQTSYGEILFAFVDKVIDGTGRDGEYIKDSNIELDDNFKEKYAKHLMKRFDIKEDDVVVNNSNTDLVEYVGRKTDKEIKEVPKKIYADILNSQLTYSSSIIEEVKKEKDSRDKIDDAWYDYEYSDYKDFKEWFDKYNNQLDSQAKDEFKEVIECIEPCNFGLIKNDVWK